MNATTVICIAVFSQILPVWAWAVSHQSAQSAIHEALQSTDGLEISRAVHELVYRSHWHREEIVTALRELLENPAPERRLLAARYLYILGDDSGSETVRNIIALPSALLVPSPGSTDGVSDLRLNAAMLASTFRDKRAAAAVLALYQSTKSRLLLHSLAKLEVENAAILIKEALRDRPSWELMENFGLLKQNSEVQFITAVMNNPQMKSSTRLAAAWALTQINEDGVAKRFIRDYVDDALSHPTKEWEANKRAVVYLGTLHDADSIGTLERVARESRRDTLVQIAVANLVLNNRNNEMGATLVIKQLDKGQTALGYELARSLAITSQDPRLLQAVERLDRQNQSEGSWKLHGAGQPRWSVWSWADSYFITPPLFLEQNEPKP